KSVGAIRASRENAMTALRAGHDVLVFPGGDIDGARPFYEHRQVHFGERRGYVHVAQEANVPIVPLATIGSHYTIPMAPGGKLMARIFGLRKKVRIENVPLPVGWLTSLTATLATLATIAPLEVGLPVAMLSLVPIPARITSEFLDPIDPKGEIEEV